MSRNPNGLIRPTNRPLAGRPILPGAGPPPGQAGVMFQLRPEGIGLVAFNPGQAVDLLLSPDQAREIGLKAISLAAVAEWGQSEAAEAAKQAEVDAELAAIAEARPLRPELQELLDQSMERTADGPQSA
jgi:hypothetical protein